VLDGGLGGSGGTGLDGGLGGSGGSGLSATLFQPLAKAFCTAARTCCKRDGFYAMEMDLDDCEAKLPSRLRTSPLVDQGIITVDPSRLATCVSAYEKAATACFSTPLSAACQGLWLGTKTEGQACGGTIQFGAFDCMSVNGSAACYWEDDGRYPAGAGVCVTLPHGKAGDPCSKSCRANQDCIVDLVGDSAPLPVMCFEEDGLYCAVSSNPPVCKAFSKIGEPCAHDYQACGRDNYCDWTNQVCQRAATLGESCAAANCADGTGCGTGSRCVELSFASSSICKGTPSLP
jgi:hypothetical protein